jgi:hypothetical protein
LILLCTGYHKEEKENGSKPGKVSGSMTHFCTPFVGENGEISSFS